MNNILEITARQSCAKAWFEALRDEICGAFEALEDEALEDEAPATLYRGEPARFVRTPWQRTDHTRRRETGSRFSGSCSISS
jgi:coproporphyrinogen III oxidase